MAKNLLYYGNNLGILRDKVPSESVDLVYLDPPFKSNANYNMLFDEQDGSRAAAQMRAFEDTWRWDTASALAYYQTVEAGGRVSQAMQAFRMILGDSDMLAYLSMMAPRLIELRRVLKPTGSIYLHCDQAASHYLKLLMDAVFGPTNLRNEIIWKRTTAHNDTRRQFSRVTDSILFYAKSPQAPWYPQYQPHSATYLKSHYSRVDSSGRHYRLDNIIRSASMGRRPNLTYEYKGFTPPWGWRVIREKLEAIDAAGRLAWSKSGTPYLVRYLDEQAGEILDNLWADIPPVNSQAAERLGFSTQKPETLLERIICASSQEGETVLDPFCGCGTAVAAAQRLGRRWIGIDITHLAITVMKRRLEDSFGLKPGVDYTVEGEPVSLPDARALAVSDPYQFQWWALGLVGARPTEEKKGADKGIDGRLYFHDEPAGGKTKQIIFSVKAGKTGPDHVRELRGVIERERAAMGVLLTLQESTPPMRREAAAAGVYHSGWGSTHPRLQIITVGELLSGKRVDAPPVEHVGVTFKRAPADKAPPAQNLELPLGPLALKEPPKPEAPKQPRPRPKRPLAGTGT